MNWPAHFFIGIIVGCALAFLLNLDIAVVAQLALICAFSALVPDVDHRDSKIRQFATYVALAVGFFFSLILTCSAAPCIIDSWQRIVILSLAIFGAYNLFITFLMPSHRGIIHSLAAAAAYAFILFLLTDILVALFGVAGYLSHLLADKEIKIV